MSCQTILRRGHGTEGVTKGHMPHNASTPRGNDHRVALLVDVEETGYLPDPIVSPWMK